MVHDNSQTGFAELQREINSRWKIYIDTCSLYRTVDEGSLFWERLVPILEESGAKFTVTAETFNEFKKHKHNASYRANDSAQRLEAVLAQFTKDKQNLMLVTDGDGSFNDRAIVSIINERASKFNQVYITNDLANAWDVYRVFKYSQSIANHTKLLVYKIVGDGQLMHPNELWFLPELNEIERTDYFFLRKQGKWDEAESFLVEHSSYRPRIQVRRAVAAHKASFTQGAVGRRGADADENGRLVSRNNGVEAPNARGIDKTSAIDPIINPDYMMPKTGDVLKAVQRQKVVSVVLGKRIAKGGEGIVYEVETEPGVGSGWLAKIYKKSKLCKTATAATQTLSKIKHIVENRYDSKNIPGQSSSIGRIAKFPNYFLVNDENEFVGYLMRKGRGVQLSRFIADGSVESVFMNEYPNMTKTALVEICINFLTAMRALHERGIIVGDLNSNNILVDPQTHFVTLIDADSYQYGNKYPCNVGVEKYTSPEFLKKHDSNFRTEQNELFVEARILCEILLMVDNPYNSKNASGDPVRDMVNGEFRYTFDFMNGCRQTNAQAPGEEMEIRWGQLSRELKNSFGNTFHHDGKYWSPGTRLDEDYWIKALSDYKDEIAKSAAEGDGFVSDDVFPKARRAWVVPFKCVKCGKGGLHDANLFVPAVRLAPTYEDIGEVARHHCLDCYCRELNLVEDKCVLCGKATLARDDGGDHYCQSCFSESQSKVVCSKCGREMVAQVRDKNRLEYICSDCRSAVRCKECGKQVVKWISNQQNGLCDRCYEVSRYPVVLCAKCGKSMGRQKPVPAGREHICRECWTPAKCSKCGFDNNGKLAKWMLDENGGLCRRCAEQARKVAAQGRRSSVRENSSTHRTVSSATAALGAKEKKIWLERLLEKLFGI